MSFRGDRATGCPNPDRESRAKIDILNVLRSPIIRILEKFVKDNPAIWSRKLDDALWAFLTAYKNTLRYTPYKLIYGKNCRLPFEMEHRAYWALKNCNPYLIVAGSLEVNENHITQEITHFEDKYNEKKRYQAKLTRTFETHQSASGNDASTASTAKADPGISAPSDFIPQQQGMNKGTKITSYDHSFAGTDPHVLADQTKSVSKGLDTVLTQPLTGKGVSLIARQVNEEEASNTIKLEDLAKLVSHVQPIFKDLDSHEDDPVIVVDDSDEEVDDEVHATKNVQTKGTSVPKSSSPRSSQIQELSNQVLILQSQKHKLELEKNKAEAEVALLKAQASFPNVK
ncbi:hypothetical protein Tco_0073165 [Tanacetum coccineum]